MKKRSLRLAAAAALALVAAALAGCRKDGRLAVGSILFDASNEWFVEAIAGMQDAARSADVALTVLDSHYDANVEKEMIRAQLKGKAGAIVICPLTVEESGRALAEAAGFHVPVVTWNTQVEPRPTAQIVVDAAELGGGAGKYLVDYVRQRGITSLKAALLVDRSFAIGIERCEGFKAAVQPLVDEGVLEVVFEASSQLGEESKVTVRKLLSERPDVQFIWCWHQMTLGSTVEVLKELRRTDVLVAGADMSVSLAKEMLADDVQVIAVTTQLPYEMGYQAVESAVKAARGEAVEQTVSIPTYTYTKEDVAGLNEYISTHAKFIK